ARVVPAVPRGGGAAMPSTRGEGRGVGQRCRSRRRRRVAGGGRCVWLDAPVARASGVLPGGAVAAVRAVDLLVDAADDRVHDAERVPCVGDGGRIGDVVLPVPPVVGGLDGQRRGYQARPRLPL
ncbi:hypothetical protein HK405_000119, partial [Cladochytrium tenue]